QRIPLLAKTSENLGKDKTADAVIDRPADEEIFAKRLGLVRIDGRVTHAKTESLHLVLRGGTDVHIELVDLWHLFIGRVLAKVNRGIADDSPDCPFVSHDVEA